jgi:hypothetical protein
MCWGRPRVNESHIGQLRETSKVRHSGAGRNPVPRNNQELGMDWIPASAGMTGFLDVPHEKARTSAGFFILHAPALLGTEGRRIVAIISRK